MKKYELTNETREWRGHTLHRIKYLVDLPGIEAGDLGGWVEKECNLSHEGNAQVYGDARVYGDACVCGDAMVCGDARVYGDAMVLGNAQVCDNAQVCGNARVCDNALVCGNARVYGDAMVRGNAQVYGGLWDKPPLFIQGTRWSFNVAGPDLVRCGCQIHTWAEWHDRYRKISAEHDGGDVLEEYIQYFNLACRLYGHEDCIIAEKEATI